MPEQRDQPQSDKQTPQKPTPKNRCPPTKSKAHSYVAVLRTGGSARNCPPRCSVYCGYAGAASEVNHDENNTPPTGDNRFVAIQPFELLFQGADVNDRTKQNTSRLNQSEPNNTCFQTRPLSPTMIRTGETEVVTSITKNDVVLGRGSAPVGNIGNTRFRDIIQGRKMEYVNTNKRKDKDLIARQVMSAVARHQGRFLQKVDPVRAEQLGVPRGVEAWRVLGETTVLKKIKDFFLRDREAKTFSVEQLVEGVSSELAADTGTEQLDIVSERPRKRARAPHEASRGQPILESVQPSGMAGQPAPVMTGAAATAFMQPTSGYGSSGRAGGDGSPARRNFPARPSFPADFTRGDARSAGALFPPGTLHSRNPDTLIAALQEKEKYRGANREVIQSLPDAPGRSDSLPASQRMTNSPALEALHTEMEEQRQAKRAAMTSFATNNTDQIPLTNPSTGEWLGRGNTLDPLSSLLKQRREAELLASLQIPFAAPGATRQPRNDISALAAALSDTDQHHEYNTQAALLSHSPGTTSRQALDHRGDSAAALWGLVQRQRNLPQQLAGEPASLSSTGEGQLGGPTITTNPPRAPTIHPTVEQRRQAARALYNRLTQQGGSRGGQHPSLSPRSADSSNRSELQPLSSSAQQPSPSSSITTNEEASLLLSSMLSRFAANEATRGKNEEQSQQHPHQRGSQRYDDRTLLPAPQGGVPGPPHEERLVVPTAAAVMMQQETPITVDRPPRGMTTGEACLWKSLGGGTQQDGEPIAVSLSLTELLSLIVLCRYGLPTWGPDLGKAFVGSGAGDQPFIIPRGAQQPSSEKRSRSHTWHDFALSMQRAGVDWGSEHPQLRHRQAEVDRTVGKCMAYTRYPKWLAKIVLSLFQKLHLIAREHDTRRRPQQQQQDEDDCLVLTWIQNETRRWKETLHVTSSYTASDYNQASSTSVPTIHLISHLTASSCRAIVKQASSLSYLSHLVTQLGDRAADGSLLYQHLQSIMLLRDNDDDDTHKSTLPSWWQAHLIHYDTAVVQALAHHGYPGVLKAPLPYTGSASTTSPSRSTTREEDVLQQQQSREQDQKASSRQSSSLEERGGGVTCAVVQNRAQYLIQLLTNRDSRKMIQDQLTKRCYGRLEAIYQAEAAFR